MTKPEKHALKKMLENDRPYSCGPSYDENFQQLSSGDPSNLLDDPRYKLGFERCHAYWQQRLEFLMAATAKDLIKFAGRPK